MTDTNSFERLKQQRKKVPSRSSFLDQQETSTVKTDEPVSSSNEIDSSDSKTEVSQLVNESPVHLAEPKALSHALHDDGADAPQTKVPAGDRWSNQTSEPIRRTIRLEPETDEQINSICQSNKITRETLFEAAVMVCGQNQKTMSKVINEAQRRYSERKKAGEIKKIKTMSRKYS